MPKSKHRRKPGGKSEAHPGRGKAPQFRPLPGPQPGWATDPARWTPEKRVFPNQLESPGFARNFGSCGEVEGLHLVGVLTFGDEFREDVGLVGIQQKFRKALA